MCVEIRIRVFGNTGAVPPTYDRRVIRYRKHGLWGVAPTILGFWGRRRGERSATRLRKNVSLFDEFRDMSTSTFACTQIVGLALGHGRGVLLQVQGPLFRVNPLSIRSGGQNIFISLSEDEAAADPDRVRVVCAVVRAVVDTR